MRPIHTAQVEEIAKLLRLVEAADLDAGLKYVMFPSGIPVVDSEEEHIVLGHLVAVDAGIWTFEPYGAER